MLEGHAQRLDWTLDCRRLRRHQGLMVFQVFVRTPDGIARFLEIMERVMVMTTMVRSSSLWQE